MKTEDKMRTPFDESSLKHYKELLREKRRDAENEIEILENIISNLNDADDADYSSVAHHMGDVGTDVEEEEMNYQLHERLKKYLDQIDEALERIENGTYGICQATGDVISRERLEAVPHTRYSIRAKKEGLVESE